MSPRNSLAYIALLLAPWVPASAIAQDDEFEFGEEDFDEDKGGSDDEMTFESDDGGDDDGEDMKFESDEEAGLPRTLVLIIPSPGAEPELAQRFTDALEKYVTGTNRYEVVESDEFRAQLFGPGAAAAMDCATNAVCLSGYGKDLWIDSVIVGILYRGEGGWKTETNKIDVERAEVESYVSYDDDRLDRRGGVELDEIATTLGKELLGLTYLGVGDEKKRVKLVPMRGPLQTRLAWGTAGLAAAAVITAGALGFQARGIESDLKSDDTLQTKAAKLIPDGEAKARSANIFLGLSVAAAVGSIALFLIKPLQEVERRPTGPTPGFDDDPDASRSLFAPEFSFTGTGAAVLWRLK